ncbi:MAG: DUF4071 domain-containing protein [Acidobacteria bacterium]|nr:DUF4071 domain-containing protein [Acidobacteriota bacterium]
MNRPLCFVLMPFGKKPDLAGALVDFDAVYHDLIAPAVAEAGLEPLRADEEIAGGVIHKPMFERLILCQFAVADLTTANANVFYELGIRHATRPWSTVLLFSERGRLPFDVASLRAIPYRLTPEGGPDNVVAARRVLRERLEETRRILKDGTLTDSPIYQLVEGYPEIDHTKTDIFRERVRYSMENRQKLAAARKLGIEAVRELEKSFEPVGELESGVVIDLFLSYRAVKGWAEMIDLAGKMARPLAETVMVQEQLALALNRAGGGDEAENVLKTLLERRGPSSETCGILGRVYKDRWEAALKAGEGLLARGMLEKAIEAYGRGFEADWRDAYPGVNAVTLMELKEPPDPARLRLLPVVTYAVERRIAAGKPDYWDHATLLELAVLAKEEYRAFSAAVDTLASVREVWEPETTVRNLRLIREARAQRGEDVPWAREIERALEQRAQVSAAPRG